MELNRKLILADGSEYLGTGFGGSKTVVCEIVFNTSMAGYQEIVSDPSYTDQAIVMSYPLIGNYGVADEDFESRMISPSAFIVRDINDNPSNFRSAKTLPELLEENGIPGICGVDTRKLVRSIRDNGSGRCIITDEDMSAEEGLKIIEETPIPHDAVKRCSCSKKWYSRTSNPLFNVVAIDCGMKSNIVRMLNRSRCNVTIVPYDTDWEEILSLHPDGVFISNGPGDPCDVPEVIETLKNLRGKIPMFGICLGHQLLSLSYGAKTYKLKFGHRGGNHPVRDVRSGKIEITSQNHSYAVEEESLKGTGLKVSHINVLDNTVEGIYSDEDKVFSVQYHPESAPGPQDSGYLFSRFTDLMKRG
ncbi:MAG: glutamine-hydrolyzing carbamoyl-phosphate synthase small subunit [Lachnospiraceae bacterium]|nr:glutamine-hydrolyzing carbamoyl-phosphate synthase small subunit [Lachnospiraceae bacterium]MBP3241068.1 glutamine-hydrolyzing carbamoyl-phosphate synthase small subunit [Oribacterium sp.]